jgi:hypothetical protein
MAIRHKAIALWQGKLASNLHWHLAFSSRPVGGFLFAWENASNQKDKRSRGDVSKVKLKGHLDGILGPFDCNCTEPHHACRHSGPAMTASSLQRR